MVAWRNRKDSKPAASPRLAPAQGMAHNLEITAQPAGSTTVRSLSFPSDSIPDLSLAADLVSVFVAWFNFSG